MRSIRETSLRSQDVSSLVLPAESSGVEAVTLTAPTTRTTCYGLSFVALSLDAGLLLAIHVVSTRREVYEP